jgi:hypothetical protein
MRKKWVTFEIFVKTQLSLIFTTHCILIKDQKNAKDYINIIKKTQRSKKHQNRYGTGFLFIEDNLVPLPVALTGYLNHENKRDRCLITGNYPEEQFFKNMCRVDFFLLF